MPPETQLEKEPKVVNATAFQQAVEVWHYALIGWCVGKIIEELSAHSHNPRRWTAIWPKPDTQSLDRLFHTITVEAKDGDSGQTFTLTANVFIFGTDGKDRRKSAGNHGIPEVDLIVELNNLHSWADNVKAADLEPI
jgi:hypothetical protein